MLYTGESDPTVIRPGNAYQRTDVLQLHAVGDPLEMLREVSVLSFRLLNNHVAAQCNLN